MTRRRFALVAGGGTAGHVLPALAVARALVQSRGEGSVELVGSRRGMEARLLDGEPIASTLLPGRGIVRHLDVRSLLHNAGAALGLAAACGRALGLVATRRPAVVVAVGGYASVPAALAAVAWRVPLVLVNIDAVPGAANRLLAPFARACAVAYPGTPLPRAVTTGVPVRAEVAAAGPRDEGRRRAARRTLGMPEDRTVIACFGGSLGARRINEAVVDLARRWAPRRDVALYHVVGRRDAGWAAECGVPVAGRDRGSLAPGEGPEDLWYRQVAYEDRMDLLYQAADVAVCRAGAMTVAELTAVGLPAVLVPLPGAPGDHQTANARVLERAGAARIVADPDCTGELLARLLDSMTGDGDRLASMGRAAAGLGRADAAEAIAVVAEAHARPRGTQPGHRAACSPAPRPSPGPARRMTRHVA